MRTCVTMPHPASLAATNSLQNHLQALHSHAQRPHRKVFALSGRHRAAYFIQSDALRPARSLSLSLRQTATPHLGCAPSSESGLFPSPVQRHGTLSVPNYAPSLTLAFLRTSKKNLSFLGWRSTFSGLSVRVLCIPDFSVSVFIFLLLIDFYCSAPMFLVCL